MGSYQLAYALPIKRIKDFCLKWGIIRFEVFGSILRSDFSPQSDIDVLVSFDNHIHHSLFDLVDMKEELESVLDRKVDILTRKSVEMSRNYIRREDILKSAKAVWHA
jgi:predicted nucleotidyltransferase